MSLHLIIEFSKGIKMAVAITATPQAQQGEKTYRFAFSVVTSLFFMFGLITCLNDILIPHLKTLFNLDYARASLVQLCFFGAFFLVSIPAGRLVQKIGYKGGAIAGLIATAVGCFIFYPAASLKSYNLFLFGLFVLASGVTLIQVAVNPYIAILGPAKTSSVRLNLAQAFNSLGTTLAPLIGAALILSVPVKTATELSQLSSTDLEVYRDFQASSVQMPYIVLALVLLILAAIMAFSKLPKFDLSDADADLKLSKSDTIWKSRRLLWGAFAIFCYVGAEVAIGSFLINYIGLESLWGMPEAQAGKYVALYWGGAMIGRFVASVVLKKIGPTHVLGFNAFTAAILVLISMMTSGDVAVWTIVAVGLFNSVMFPTIFTLAIEGLGKNTPKGSAVLCMAIVGGAVVPVLQGILADNLGLQPSFIMPILCYAFILFYSVKLAKTSLATA